MNEIEKVSTLFSREQLFQAYLDVEEALAKAQAKVFPSAADEPN